MWTMYLQTLWHCCSVWAMGPSEHQDATATAAAAAAFSSGGFRRAQGSQQRAWASHCLHSGTPDTSLSLLLHSFPPLQPWMSREWVGEAGGGKASCSTGDGSSQCLQVLCGCWALQETERLHSSWEFPHPSQALCRCLSPTSPSQLNITDPLSFKLSHPVPGSHWFLSATFSSPGIPLPTFPRRRKLPPVPAWIYFRYWKEIFDLNAAPLPHLKSPELNQPCRTCGDPGPPQLGWALSSVPILTRSTLHPCSSHGWGVSVKERINQRELSCGHAVPAKLTWVKAVTWNSILAAWEDQVRKQGNYIQT